MTKISYTRCSLCPILSSSFWKPNYNDEGLAVLSRKSTSVVQYDWTYELYSHAFWNCEVRDAEGRKFIGALLLNCGMVLKHICICQSCNHNYIAYCWLNVLNMTQGSSYDIKMSLDSICFFDDCRTQWLVDLCNNSQKVSRYSTKWDNFLMW